jgi:energy-coupling factor transporter transmembrane protein EcfT
MKSTLRYSLRVWLISALGSPIIYFVIGIIKEVVHSTAKGLHPATDLLTLPLLYIFIVVCTCIVSLPTVVTFFLAVVAIKKIRVDSRYQVILALLISQLLVVLTFVLFLSLFPGFEQNSYYILMSCHCIIIGVSVWWYRGQLFNKTKAD